MHVYVYICINVWNVVIPVEEIALLPTHYLTKLLILGMRKKTLSWSSVKSKRFSLRPLPFLFVARPYYRRHYIIQTGGLEWALIGKPLTGVLAHTVSEGEAA